MKVVGTCHYNLDNMEFMQCAGFYQSSQNDQTTRRSDRFKGRLLGPLARQKHEE
jgi:hypothetical protein